MRRLLSPRAPGCGGCGEALARARASAAVAPLLLLGCLPAPPPPAGDRHLLERFEPVVEAGAPESFPVVIDGWSAELDPAVPNRVRLARSERRALVTGDGVRWSWTVGDGIDGEALAFSIAVLGPAGGEAVVERVRGETRDELYRAGLDPGAWSRRRVPVSAEPGDRLVLRSAGPSPAAWAELHGLSSAQADRRTQDPARPDLVLISIDTVRADHLSVYGYPRATTPQLERLAAESLLFRRSLSASTWTLPSTASLLTGLLPAQHGLLAVNHRLAPRVETLAERLRRSGYRTAAITDGGFVGFDWGFSQGFERFDATAGEAWTHHKDVAEIAAAASRWIEENRFHPFFLLIHTYEAHKPYVNTEGFADPFLDPAYDGPFEVEARFDPFDADGLTDADRQRLVDLYDGEIRRADHYLGQFLDRLRASGRWHDTAVVVTSDHGEEFLEHGRFDHGFAQLYDPNVRVPLILKPPRDRMAGAVSAGAGIDRPASGLDVAPTLLDLAGVTDTAELPGRSLLALAADPAADADRTVFVHATNSFPKIREERFRLDRGPVSVHFDRVRGVAEWYDLERDPEMRSPQGDVFEGRAAPAARRLQSILAWSEDAELMAELPEGARSLAVEPTSKLAPAGAWSGLSWRPAVAAGDGGWRVEVDPDRPHVLVFSPRSGVDGWSLLLQKPGGDSPEELRLRAARPEPGWNPLQGPLAEPGHILPCAALFLPGTGELSAENLEELKALGYL